MGDPQRVWSPSMGAGSLDHDGRTVRFVADGGAAVSFALDGIHVGTPAAWAASHKNTQRVNWGTPYGSVEWLRWDTFIGEHGDVLVVRRGGPPPEGTPAPEATVHYPKGFRRPKRKELSNG